VSVQNKNTCLESMIKDTVNDGVCCRYGVYYEVTINEVVKASGGKFADMEWKKINVSCLF